MQQLYISNETQWKVNLCLDPVILNQTLIRPFPRLPTVNDIFPRVNNVEYLSLIDASLVYYNLSLMEDYHTSQHLNANLAGTDTRDCYLRQPYRG